jgi:hypothetical protein
MSVDNCRSVLQRLQIGMYLTATVIFLLQIVSVVVSRSYRYVVTYLCTWYQVPDSFPHVNMRSLVERYEIPYLSTVNRFPWYDVQERHL